ncbi:arginase family protein [Micromonospora zamorensis]|uniref:arginase family protein n=1 Tax=Micromonospora zamorensis TaxID=709883 RepID=UPI0037180B60
MRWTVVDAPLDSSGAGRGEERAPAALRDAGLLDALAADDGGRGDEACLRDAVRDPASGVIAAIGCDGPLLDPGRVHLLGHRSATDDSSRAEAARIDPAIHQVPAAELLRRGAGTVGAGLATGGDGPAWLHLDLDVVDPRDLPAVTYPEPDGPRWADLIALVTPLARADRLLGMSVTDLNTDEDPTGRHTRRVVEVLAEVLGSADG